VELCTQTLIDANLKTGKRGTKREREGERYDWEKSIKETTVCTGPYCHRWRWRTRRLMNIQLLKINLK